MLGVNWKLEDDLKSVTISFPSKPPVGLRFNTAEVDETLKNLGEFRASMQPPIPANWSLDQKVEAIPDPAWYTEPEMMMGNSILHIRDPRFGWLHFLLPRENARKLGELLTRQAVTPPPESTQEKPS